MSHRRWIRREGGSEELADALARGDLGEHGLASPERVMLEYAAKLTLEPAAVAQGDIEGLRAAGFSDAAIGDIVLITAMYAMMNRLVDGIGESLPEGMAAEAARIGVVRGQRPRM